MLDVVVLNISIKGTMPSDLNSFPIGVPLGLILLNETPCPPWALYVSARLVFNCIIPSMLSGT